MKNKLINITLILFLLNGCVGASSKGIFGTGVSVALDPRTVGTQIDDGIMDKNLDAKLLLMNKNYLLSVSTQVLDGRIFVTGKVDQKNQQPEDIDGCTSQFHHIEYILPIIIIFINMVTGSGI